MEKFEISHLNLSKKYFSMRREITKRTRRNEKILSKSQKKIKFQDFSLVFQENSIFMKIQYYYGNSQIEEKKLIVPDLKWNISSKENLTYTRV